MKLFLVVFVVLLLTTVSYGQHNIQLDNGLGQYSIIVGASTGGTFTLPNGGGTFLTSTGGSSPAWLVGGNTSPSSTFVGNNTALGNLDLRAGNATLLSLNGTSGAVTIAGAVFGVNGVSYTFPAANAVGVMTNNGSGTLTWAAGGGGGLVNFTESVNTAAPNAPVPVVRLLATNAATDVDVALTPKGMGALMAQVPDNTATGGDKRGIYAVDWQIFRALASQVASGDFAALGGGQLNIASGYSSTVGGGTLNIASNTYSTVCGGISNTASEFYSTVCAGQANTASGNRSTVCGGQANTASGPLSFINGGINAVASNYGQMAHSAGKFTNDGDAQTSVFVLRRQTINNVATSLGLDGGTRKLPIPTNGAMTFKATIVGKITGSTAVNVGGWEIIGTITNNAGTATIMGANITRTLNTPAGWGVPTVIGNGANMDIQVTGPAATTIDWVARLETVEVVF